MRVSGHMHVCVWAFICAAQVCVGVLYAGAECVLLRVCLKQTELGCGQIGWLVPCVECIRLAGVHIYCTSGSEPGTE